MTPSPVELRKIGERAEEFYEQKLRTQVETDDNIGKIILIDVNSGDYEIDDVSIEASRRLKARRPDAEPCGLRIGYSAAYSFGGTLTRRKR